MVYRCSYFNIKELVSPTVYNVWGDKAWMFFTPAVLKDLDIIRDSWQSPIIINNWSSGGSLKQCGLRSNLDQIPKDKTKSNQLYLSFHTMGRAVDLHDVLGRNQKLWQHCYNLIKKGSLEAINRIEKWENTSNNGGWVHIDSANTNFSIFS